MHSNGARPQIKEELRKRWAAQAVELALMGHWDEAVQVNLRILELFPDDIRARNRLGKAYAELGRPEDAAAAYEESLKQQPSNPIARENLTQLFARLDREAELALDEGMLEEESAEEDEEEPEDYFEEEDLREESADDSNE